MPPLAGLDSILVWDATKMPRLTALRKTGGRTTK